MCVCVWGRVGGGAALEARRAAGGGREIDEWSRSEDFARWGIEPAPTPEELELWSPEAA